MKIIVPLLLVVASLFASGDVIAGQQPVLREQKFNFEQIAMLAKSVERLMAKHRARVALISRVGLNPDLLPPGVRYSHTALAVYSKVRTHDGRIVPGYAIFNLYQGDERTGRSRLVQDYPLDYFAVSQELHAGVLIPNEGLQNALLEMLASDRYRQLHNPNYSVIANPFNTIYQNCTEFVLDVVFGALYETTNRGALKAYIASYFEPHPILLPPTKIERAARVMSDVSIDDHVGAVATTTFSSIVRFLLKYQIARNAFVVSTEPTTLYVTTKTWES